MLVWMKNLRWLRRLACAVLAALACAPVWAVRETIQIAGSATVLPFASIAAEEFGQAFARFRTPVVASGGSGGGLRQFCRGVGSNTIDVANASRPMRAAERENCWRNGVRNIVEVRFGLDAIVFASHQQTQPFALTFEHVFLAAARSVPQGGEMVPNPYQRWSQIDPALPDVEIVLLWPAANHGTRETLEEKVLVPGCEVLAAMGARNDTARRAACTRLRRDGRLIEVAGDYTETLARLAVQPQALGVFGLGFFEQNRDRLRVATVNGVAPTREAVAANRYPVSRPLFFYVKGEHFGLVPGLREYAAHFLSPALDEPLAAAGLTPLDDAARQRALAGLRDETEQAAP